MSSGGNRERRVDWPRQVIRCCEHCGQPIDAWEEVLEFAGVQVAQNALIYGKQSRKMKRGEIVLMRQLILRGRLSHEAFLMAINSDAEVSTGNVYACVVRKALRELGAPVEIRTIFGWGYELVGAPKPL